jgi:hypothetical protein
MLVRTVEAAPPVSELALRRAERALGVTLPADYRTFLLTHNGGRPVPSGFKLNVNGEPKPWAIHFFLGVDDPEDSCCLQWCESLTRNTRPPGTIPIASDDFGNFIYLRLSEPLRGSVHFGATPSDGQNVRLVHISDSFSDFVECLGDMGERDAV